MASKWRLLGLVLVVAGTLTLVSPSLGFTLVEGDRRVDVGTATDPNANLGIEDVSSSAEITDTDDSAKVFNLIDNIGGFAESDFSTTVTEISNSGNTIQNPDLTATVSQSSTSGEFDLTVQCSTSTDTIDDSYYLTVDISVTSADISIDATRTTDSLVPVSCVYDYGDTSNYRDGDGGAAAQPENPQGDIQNPSAVNECDDDSAIAISQSGGDPARVGFSLPDQPSSTQYELEIQVENNKQGKWNTYLLNKDGVQLINTRSLGKGVNTFTFSSSENTDIRNNRDELYLVFETNSKGNKNQISIDCFELRAI